MSDIDLEYLFTPGDGGAPPYLAGRKEEQEYFGRCVKALKDRKPISRNLILYGPRGNGKTTLLRHLQKETLQKEGSTLDILWETPNEMETLTELSARLMEGKPKIRDWFKSVAVSVSAGFVSGKTEVGNPGRESTIRKLLQERCQKKPLALIIDEAHTLQPEVGKALLNISQTLRSEGYPFLLVLAGTPNLRTTLSKTNASFWERSERMRLGRLSPDEARQAITVPLEQVGVSFTPGAAGEVVERAHCYPYFLQIWGDCLARRLDQTRETQVTMDMVNEVDTTVVRIRDELYQDRFVEIERMRLLPAAARVADAFIQAGEPTLHGNTLKDAIAKGMTDDDGPATHKRIMERFDQLFQLGYIWRAEGADYEPGISSLMPYVYKNASLAQQPEKECDRIQGVS